MTLLHLKNLDAQRNLSDTCVRGASRRAARAPAATRAVTRVRSNPGGRPSGCADCGVGPGAPGCAGVRPSRVCSVLLSGGFALTSASITPGRVPTAQENSVGSTPLSYSVLMNSTTN